MAKATKESKLKKTKVSIIILTINSLKMVSEELKDISKLLITGIDVECIVVDNGSTDGTENYFKNFSIDNMSFKYIQTGSNLGFAEGNNVGIRYALQHGSDYVLIMNDDLILSDSLLVRLVKFMEENSNVGLVSPKIYFASGYEFHKDRYQRKDLGNVIWYAGGKIDWDNIYTSHIGVDDIDKGQFNKVKRTEIANGSCLFVRKEVFEKIGLFDRRLFLYWEDADFNVRAAIAGFGIYFYPKVSVWHKVSASAGGSGSKSNDYFLVRNRYYFAMRYAKLRTKIAVFRDTLKLLFTGRSWQKLGATHALIGVKGAGPWTK